MKHFESVMVDVASFAWQIFFHKQMICWLLLLLVQQRETIQWAAVLCRKMPCWYQGVRGPSFEIMVVLPLWFAHLDFDINLQRTCFHMSHFSWARWVHAGVFNDSNQAPNPFYLKSLNAALVPKVWQTVPLDELVAAAQMCIFNPLLQQCMHILLKLRSA